MLPATGSKECVGQCPKCQSKNLDYDCSEGMGNSRIYPFTCIDCGCEAREVYVEKYVETEWL